MSTAEKASSNDLLLKRLHEMRMSASDIASAEASLRNADALIDAGFGVAAAFRSSAEHVVRRLRAAFVSTPQQ